MVKTILLVEDEAAIREMIQSALARAGFNPVPAADAAEAERVMKQTRPDLILLDWMLPGVSGIELARRLRRDTETRDLPIIMLTARCEEPDRISGLEAGVDDYVGKPFSIRELMARIQAVLRRTSPRSEGEPMEIKGLKLDPASHRVTAEGTPIKVGPTEFRMLRFFMDNRERVFTRGQLLDNVWGDNVYVEERTVDVHIRRLRKALAPFGYDKLVQTVHGTGYRFSTHIDS
ncbi:MAG TPA: phosphate regulon transcriptional regulator PhoB [Gammaproteobacteria bacterium]|nr:phosphate regulon transcriptional regulator PhoB [Gammaproteobacteria bacterium]